MNETELNIHQKIVLINLNSMRRQKNHFVFFFEEFFFNNLFLGAI